MKTFVNFTAMVLVVAILVGLGYAAFWGYGHLGDVYAILQPVQKVVLLTVILSGLFGILILVGGLRSAARINAQGRLLERRADLYRELMTGYGVLLATNRRAEGEQALELVEALTAELTLMAGSQVIAANARLMDTLHAERVEETVLEEAVGSLVKAMRRDLGQGSQMEDVSLGWLETLRARRTGGADLPAAPGTMSG